MKKTMQAALLTTLVAPAFFIESLTSEAVTVGQMDSNADVTFTQDTTITSPVNPLDPSKMCLLIQMTLMKMAQLVP